MQSPFGGSGRTDKQKGTLCGSNVYKALADRHSNVTFRLFNIEILFQIPFLSYGDRLRGFHSPLRRATRARL